MKSDDIAESTLQQLGYEVYRIPTSDKKKKKEADFIIKYKGYIAIVEAKLKEDDKNEVTKLEDILSCGKVYTNEAKLGRNETLSGIIGKASRQLKSSSDKEHDFKMMLFIASGINVKTKADQFKDTIYGSTLILETIISNTKWKKCYFYRYSDFYRRKALDAAIVGYIQGEKLLLELCLNPYSNNYDLLKVSEFIKPFGDGVIDPFQEEKLGKAYIPDDNYKGKKEQPFSKKFPLYDPVLQHLAEKYGTNPLIKVDFESPEFITIMEVNKNKP